MKLYTEEQVNELRRALKDVAQWDEFLEDDWEDAGNRAMDALRCFEKELPIELPSNEEIMKIAIERFPISMEDFGGEKIDGNEYFRSIFIQGIEYFIKRIQGGNK